MKVLVIGSGGREHALVWKIAASPLLGKLYCTPGNPGIGAIAETAALDTGNHASLAAFCRQHRIDLVVVGPEAPLVGGLVDSLRRAGIRAFGPDCAAARLEGSKSFTKDLCARFNIPTAAYGCFNNAPKAKAYIRAHGAPIVVKADGLAAGKGVVVAMNVEEACNAVDACFEGAFGAAGGQVVVEEFLHGEEVSFFCLCDGKTALALGSVQDHKRVGDGDTGANTGGMGAYAPATIVTQPMEARIMQEIIQPTMDGMAAIGAPFQGILFAGLMLTPDGPKLIEYNVRFGDPECQVLLMRLENDLLPLLVAAADGELDQASPEWSDDVALTVVLAAEGYPHMPRKGSVIDGVEEAAALPGIMVFHAGTAMENGRLTANGGRVLNVTARGANVVEARAKAYAAIEKIRWPQGFCRTDIGWREVERQKPQ
ncbi:MAG: Phosphoribosylamine--glycine ligase [Candidatus Tokpelaia hoelldobleri]|uniref:Phosphoribosylamine--glycine ligase n=1 Tax=Candidatus Tokpelaia hoelldobleri TaxID=1902579 RepID=A0A1U9JWR5_9HYPH|nr:MAG: Phosphoribosylamine--glycine ligase [Candidatus Tokpelaia hoelldoblerii]